MLFSEASYIFIGEVSSNKDEGIITIGALGDILQRTEFGLYGDRISVASSITRKRGYLPGHKLRSAVQVPCI
jgi:hypothetical protein